MGQLAQEVQQMEDKVNTLVHQLQEAKICLFRALRNDMNNPIPVEQTEEILASTIMMDERGVRMVYNAREIAPEYEKPLRRCRNCGMQHVRESEYCSDKCRDTDDLPF